MIINKEWIEKQKVGDPNNLEETAPDPYVLAIIRVGEKVLELLEALPETMSVDADALIHEADRALNEGITGNMAHYVALIAVKCHSRGEEFRKSFNKSWGKEDAKGLVNPAIITIKD